MLREKSLDGEHLSSGNRWRGDLSQASGSRGPLFFTEMTGLAYNQTDRHRHKIERIIAIIQHNVLILRIKD